jgi:hypothetical protein
MEAALGRYASKTPGLYPWLGGAAGSLSLLYQLAGGRYQPALSWRLIKSRFSKMIPKTETIDEVRLRRGERGIWQRRYRKHPSRLQTLLEKV